MWLEPSAEKRRRVPFVCQLVDNGSGPIFVNYKYKNQLFLEAFKSGALDEVLGKYKYIVFYDGGQEALYDLEADFAEKHNLARQLPETARQMRLLLQGWQQEVAAVFPQNNPQWS